MSTPHHQEPAPRTNSAQSQDNFAELLELERLVEQVEDAQAFLYQVRTKLRAMQRRIRGEAEARND